MKPAVYENRVFKLIITALCIAVVAIAALISIPSVATAEGDTTDSGYRVYVYDSDGDIIVNRKIEPGSLVTIKLPVYEYAKTYDADNKTYVYSLTGRFKGVRPLKDGALLPDYSYFSINSAEAADGGRDTSTISYMFWMPKATLYIKADYMTCTSDTMTAATTALGDASDPTAYLKVATTSEGYVEMSSIMAYGDGDSVDISSPYIIDTTLASYTAVGDKYYTVSRLSDGSAMFTKRPGELVTYAGILDSETDIDHLEFIDSKAREIDYDPNTGIYTTKDGISFSSAVYRYLSPTGERKYLITFPMPADDIRISNIVTKSAQVIEEEPAKVNEETDSDSLPETINSQGEYTVSGSYTENGETYVQTFYINTDDIQANRDAILELQDQASGISIFYVAQNSDGSYIVPEEVQEVLKKALGTDSLNKENISSYIQSPGYYIISGTELSQTLAAKKGYTTVSEYAKALADSTQKLANLPDGATICLVSDSDKRDYTLEEFTELYSDYLTSSEDSIGSVAAAYTKGWYMVATYGSVTKVVKITDEVVLIGSGT